jgi:hypothetical protein
MASRAVNQKKKDQKRFAFVTALQRKTMAVRRTGAPGPFNPEPTATATPGDGGG